VVEALRAGVPVLANDVGGLSELVDHGRAGYLVDVDDDQTLASRLAELVADAPRRQAFSIYAASRDWSAHEPDRVGAAIARLYGAALDERELETGGLSGQTAPSCGY